MYASTLQQLTVEKLHVQLRQTQGLFSRPFEIVAKASCCLAKPCHRLLPLLLGCTGLREATFRGLWNARGPKGGFRQCAPCSRCTRLPRLSFISDVAELRPDFWSVHMLRLDVHLSGTARDIPEALPVLDPLCVVADGCGLKGHAPSLSSCHWQLGSVMALWADPCVILSHIHLIQPQVAMSYACSD